MGKLKGMGKPFLAGTGGLVILISQLVQLDKVETRITEKLNNISTQLEVVEERNKHSDKERASIKDLAEENRLRIRGVDGRVIRIETVIEQND